MTTETIATREVRSILSSKVPQVTVFFWIIKVLCTTVGETVSDFLNVNLGLGLQGTAIAAGAALFVALVVQFKTKKYVPGVYWLAVVLISVFGTLLTDILTDSLKFPLEGSAVIFSVALGLTFSAWYATEKTLSIHSIFSARRELFYWLAILFTFALGTATGDLMAEKLGLGYLVTGLIVLGVIAAAAVAWRAGLDAVLAFWIAYILTRPLGASLGDYLSQSRENGGLGLGATATSAAFLVAILAVVIYLVVTQRDASADPLKPEPPETKGRNVVWQVVAVVVLLLGAGAVGYKWRRAALQQQAVASVSVDRPLGDLSTFRHLALTMRDLVHSGEIAAATSSASELETAWDHAQATLQSMNLDKWTRLDGAIDVVLKCVRSSHATECGASLEALVAAIDSLDKPR